MQDRYRYRRRPADSCVTRYQNLAPQPPLPPYKTQRLVENLVGYGLPILKIHPLHSNIRMPDGPGQCQHSPYASTPQGRVILRVFDGANVQPIKNLVQGMLPLPASQSLTPSSIPPPHRPRLLPRSRDTSAVARDFIRQAEGL